MQQTKVATHPPATIAIHPVSSTCFGGEGGLDGGEGGNGGRGGTAQSKEMQSVHVSE